MRCAALIVVVIAVLVAPDRPVVHAQTAPALAPLPKACEAPADMVTGSSPLPNIAIALRERKKIKILAIGGTSASLRGPVSGGHYAVVEQFLEATYKGLDVEVIHRGVSGELAFDAAERIKTEVALTNADLVLWQLGTVDAMARVSVADFYVAVSTTVAWLKEHKIDIIMVGLRYARSIETDLHFQATRTAVADIAKKHNVLRISRYESEQTLEKVRRSQGTVLGSVEITEAGYACMAEVLARAIAAGLFVKDAPQVQPGKKQP